MGGLQTGRSFFHGAGLRWLEKGEGIGTVLLGRKLSPESAVRQGLDLYTNSAGIETGYGFFAPNVPDNYKLVFEVSYPDGRTEVQLPAIGNDATGVRLVDLLDRLSEVEHPALRELMMRMLATSIWREHPEAGEIRAIFGLVKLPSLQAFQRGERESYETLFAYDFNFAPPESQP